VSARHVSESRTDCGAELRLRLYQRALALSLLVANTGSSKAATPPRLPRSFGADADLGSYIPLDNEQSETERETDVQNGNSVFNAREREREREKEGGGWDGNTGGGESKGTRYAKTLGLTKSVDEARRRGRGEGGGL
jgi:hypothetical protein